MNDDQHPDWYLPDEEPEPQSDNLGWEIFSLVIAIVLVSVACWGVWFA